MGTAAPRTASSSDNSQRGWIGIEQVVSLLLWCPVRPSKVLRGRSLPLSHPLMDRIKELLFVLALFRIVVLVVRLDLLLRIQLLKVRRVLELLEGVVAFCQEPLASGGAVLVALSVGDGAEVLGLWAPDSGAKSTLVGRRRALNARAFPEDARRWRADLLKWRGLAERGLGRGRLLRPLGRELHDLLEVELLVVLEVARRVSIGSVVAVAEQVLRNIFLLRFGPFLLTVPVGVPEGILGSVVRRSAEVRCVEVALVLVFVLIVSLGQVDWVISRQ